MATAETEFSAEELLRIDKHAKSREESLIILRGFAALAVVIAHATVVGIYQIEPRWSYLCWSPLRVLWSGHQAVILFFVHSGFALARMLENMRGSSYFTYFVSRIIRLYPTYVVSLVVAVLGYWILERCGYSWTPGWLGTIKPVLTTETVLNHLLMVGSFNTEEINPPIWSLVHEMRLSIIFPVILAAALRWDWRALVVAIFFSATLGIFTWHGKPAGLPNTVLSILMSTHYATFFLLGALISTRASALGAWSKQLSPAKRLAWWCAALMMYAYPFNNPWTLGQRIWGDLFIAIGATGLISLAFAFGSGPILNFGRWLGKISYTLYLNHFVVVNAAIVVLYYPQPAPVVWAVILLGSFALSVVLHRLVEHPSQVLSRKVRKSPARKVEAPSN
jgi:peptidoglycan/LPS O-acetylase OafA/YrhL